ncbi:MAG: YbaY family lipoprotein [Kiritimatiellae bacterium]|nr:YbaY family lipoprotein [Kiritimatiellia bacterium]
MNAKILALSAAALLAAGCSHCPVCGASWGAAERERLAAERALRPEAPPVSVRGTVTTLERATLLPTYRLRLRLLDLSSGEALATKEETGLSALPHAFEFACPGEAIRPNGSYGLSAELLADGETIFRTDTQYRVLTRGAGPSADLVLVRAPSP